MRGVLQATGSHRRDRSGDRAGLGGRASARRSGKDPRALRRGSGQVEGSRPPRQARRPGVAAHGRTDARARAGLRSEEETSELPSLMRPSYAVYCLKNKKKRTTTTIHYNIDKI